MKRKQRRTFSREDKQNIVSDYVSGRKSAQQIATDLQIDVQQIYKWKTLFEEEAKGVRIAELEAQHTPQELSKRVEQMALELEEYKMKVAEQALTIDILKKLRQQGILPSESELTGLIATMKKLDQKQKRVK